MDNPCKYLGAVIDCPDPAALAAFYSTLTGMPVVFSDENYAAIAAGDGPYINFQRVDLFRRPEWPGQDRPQQFHLDFAVEDQEHSVALALDHGAERPDFQPGAESGKWTVLLDPAGHPFCLTGQTPSE
jgi:catechol 2,3-dioxygenase-like lactoylglutathione lyase family enzyme